MHTAQGSPTVLYRNSGKELNNVGLHMGGEGCVPDSSKGMISVWSNHKARCAQQFLLYTVLPCHPDPVYGHFRSASRRLMRTFLCSFIYMFYLSCRLHSVFIKTRSDSSSLKFQFKPSFSFCSLPPCNLKPLSCSLPPVIPCLFSGHFLQSFHASFLLTSSCHPMPL